MNIILGVAVKWSFQPMTLSVINGKKKDLSEAVKIIALDKHHNPTVPNPDLVPIVTVDHST